MIIIIKMVNRGMRKRLNAGNLGGCGWPGANAVEEYWREFPIVRLMQLKRLLSTFFFLRDNFFVGVTLYNSLLSQCTLHFICNYNRSIIKFSILP